MPRARVLFALLMSSLLSATAFADPWSSYAENAQHTSLSPVASQSLSAILWQTPVDLAPTFTDDELFIHYGSPVITANNTLIVPVKTQPDGGFVISAFNAATGTLKWS